MMKVTMTAALLIALAAAPALAQTSGMSGDTMSDGASASQSQSGANETGAMGQEQSQGAQETQLPATGSTGEQTGTSTDEGSPTVETEIPVTSSTSRPANIETPGAQGQ